jgi:hypothetical protein
MKMLGRISATIDSEASNKARWHDSRFLQPRRRFVSSVLKFHSVCYHCLRVLESEYDSSTTSQVVLLATVLSEEVTFTKTREHVAARFLLHLQIFKPRKH